MCKRADNFLPVLEWYQENKCTVKRPLPDLETSIELAYSRLGLRPYAELYKVCSTTSYIKKKREEEEEEEEEGERHREKRIMNK